MNFNTILNKLKLYNIDFLIIGSHALYLLNQKFNLDIHIDITEKDLDILVKEDENFINFISDFDIKRAKTNPKNFIIYKTYNDNLKGIDLILQSNFIHMKINGVFIPNLRYETIKNYYHNGFLYDNHVRYINLESYYGIIKSTGLTKYVPIIQQILYKYPYLKQSVLV